jgi:hypothetical protein
MDRNDTVRMFILDVIADDYENLEKIRREVTALGARSGLTIHSSEIVRVLMEIIRTGLVRAYRLSPTQPTREVEGVPPQEEAEDLYYWLTDEGKKIQTSNYKNWPFDHAGNPRPDWYPPSR